MPLQPGHERMPDPSRLTNRAMEEIDDRVRGSAPHQERIVSIEDLATIGLLATMKLVPGFRFTVDDIIASADRIRIRAELLSGLPQAVTATINESVEK